MDSSPLPAHVCPTITSGIVSYDGMVLQGGDLPAGMMSTPVIEKIPEDEVPEQAKLSKATCAGSNTLVAYCAVQCQQEGKIVESCSCDPATKKPVYTCTLETICADTLKRCEELCDDSPFNKCQCNLDSRSTELVATECGDTYNADEIDSDDFFAEPASANFFALSSSSIVLAIAALFAQ